MAKFDFTAGWIFASVTAEGGVDLASLVAAADMLNRAIPTLAEISGSLSILHSFGLISISDARVHLTAHGSTVAAAGFARRGGLFSVADNMRKSLDRAEHPLSDSTPDMSFLTDAAIQEAYETYRSMTQR